MGQALRHSQNVIEKSANAEAGTNAHKGHNQEPSTVLSYSRPRPKQREFFVRPGCGSSALARHGLRLAAPAPCGAAGGPQRLQLGLGAVGVPEYRAEALTGR